jgi:hypothetical protein
VELEIHKRAEVALRSLGNADRISIHKALEKLRNINIQTLMRSRQLKKSQTPSGEPLYIYRGNLRLRIILSKQNSSWIVEDIIDHDRLDRILRERERP